MRKTLRIEYQKPAFDAAMQAMNASSEPILINATVGAGKSLLAAYFLETMELNGMRGLCLTMTSELVSQNAQEYDELGRRCGVYCAGLNRKEYNNPVIFGSAQSVWSGIRAGRKIKDQKFDLLAIDEAHNIAAHKANSVYMKIIAHLLELNPQMRILGMTGTPFRDGNNPICADKLDHEKDKDRLLFKKTVYEIDTKALVELGYLVPPKWADDKKNQDFDFSACEVNNLGNFNKKDLDQALEGKGRLTSDIVAEIVDRMNTENRRGCFIFASTVDHCKEVAASLPPGTWGIVTGSTPDKERKQIMDDAKAGKLRYLVNVNCLTVGVNIPHFDTVAFMRPTESLVLYIQAIGRALRLFNEGGKTHGLVLDFAGNLYRHGTIDDAMINDALDYKPVGDPMVELPCPICSTLNSVNARRCIGQSYDSMAGKMKRCDFYFESVPCPHCDAPNDITARNCRLCDGEIIDPNRKLRRKAAINEPTIAKVISAIYYAWQGKDISKPPILRCDYTLDISDLDYPTVTEFFNPDGNQYERGKFHRDFCAKHSPGDSEVYAASLSELRGLNEQGRLLRPRYIKFKREKGSRYLTLIDKEFDHDKGRMNGL